MKSLINHQKQIREKLKNGIPVIGSWQQIPEPSISEILANSGYDWIAIDLEHGSIGATVLPNLIRAIEKYDCLPIARIAEPSEFFCKQALDAGAGGLIIPMIESAEQLDRLIKSSNLPPIGNRGVGYSRSNLYGKNFNDFIKNPSKPIIIAQIENIKALQNLDDILNVELLDGIMVGPYDLSASMNMTGDFLNTKFLEAMNEILLKCKEHNVVCGDHIVIPEKNKLIKRLNEGYNFIAYGTDGIFLNISSKLPEIK